MTLAAFVFCALLTRLLIPFLQRKKLGQTILEIGPAWHKTKEGTPTMGGVVFLLILPTVTVLGSVWMSGKIDPSLILVLLFALANGLIGLIDDGTKLKNKRNLGLLPWQKLFLQSLFVGGFLFLLYRFSGSMPFLHLPFTPLRGEAGYLLTLLLFITLLGTVNCVNLSDGIDGLTASSTLIIGAFFLLEGSLAQSIPLISLGSVTVGTMLGFLLFNFHPAKIFMGDTGSLFLGALVASASFLTENAAVLPIYTLLFLIEGVSVILQVFIFKRSGKRLFLMAPLHHHLEKCGWSEKKIVFVFSFITLLSCLFAHFALLKS
jgi:phospho-N-acetylmuramoyl-pentapeptide-transferase